MRNRRIFLVSLAAILVFASCATGADEQGIPSPFVEKGVWGYKYESGKMAVKPKYIVALDYTSQGLATAMDEEGWVYLDTKCNEIARCFEVGQLPDPFSDDRARIQSQGKIGFINSHGEILIPAQYDYAEPFENMMSAFNMGGAIETRGIKRVITGGKWGVMDLFGKTLVEPVWDTAAEALKAATKSEEGSSL